MRVTVHKVSDGVVFVMLLDVRHDGFFLLGLPHTKTSRTSTSRDETLAEMKTR
jgi:hypothetical protein